MIRYTYLERDHPSSISRAAEGYQRAISGKQQPAEVVPIRARYGARLGGRILPSLKFRFARYDRHHLYHAVEPEVAFRGTAVTTIHTLLPFIDRTQRPADVPWRRRQYEIAAERVRTIVAINPAIVDEVREHLGQEAARKTRLVRLPLGVPEPGRLAKAYDVLWTGGTHPRKGPATFLESLLAVKRRLKVCFLIHDEPQYGEERARVQALLPKVTARHDLSTPSYPVPFAELDRLYRSSEVYVSSSYYEGFPIAVFEAYARGSKIVVPRTVNFTQDYAQAPGVQYYDYDCRKVVHEGWRDPDVAGRIAGAIDSALASGTSAPSEEVLRLYRESTVAAELADLYQKLG